MASPPGKPRKRGTSDRPGKSGKPEKSRKHDDAGKPGKSGGRDLIRTPVPAVYSTPAFSGLPGEPRSSGAPALPPASRTPAEVPLGELVRRETEALAAHARASGGAVDEARLGALERLARLHEMEQSRRTARWSRVLGGIGILAAISVALLLFSRRFSSTPVSGDLLVREMSMVLGDTQAVIPGRRLSQLTVAGLDSVRLPVGDDGYRIVPADVVVLRTERAGDTVGTLDLDEWAFPAGTAVRVRMAEPAGSYGWSVAFPSAPREVHALATISGPVTALVDGARSRLSPRYGAMVELFGKEDVQVTTAHADTAVRILPPVPAAHSLSFTQRLRYRDRSPELSAVLGGAVTLDALGARQLKLGPGQSLRFTQSEVEIPHLALERTGIRLHFSGEVEGMSTGAARRRSLMPRWLEWFAANPAWLLVGTAVLTLLGSLGPLGRWLIPQKQ